MKRLFSLCCAMLLVLAMLSGMAVSADVQIGQPDDGTIDTVYTVSTYKTVGLAAGDTFTLDVSINAQTSYKLLDVTLVYDAEKIAFVGGEKLSFMQNSRMADIVKVYDGEIKLTWMSFDGIALADGEVFARLTFEAVEDITDYAPVEFSVPDCGSLPYEGVAGGVMIIPSVTYPDVKTGAWYYDAVQYVSQNGYMTGYKSGKFGPADNLQRQDYVVILARMAGADLASYRNANGGLSDVKVGSYYAPAVAWAVDNGIITGYKSGKFGVGDSITREQVCTILYRYNNSPVMTDTAAILAAFPDAARVSAFAKDAVAWAVDGGVISGTNGKLAPTQSASRAQIATIIMRTTGAPDTDDSPEKEPIPGDETEEDW